MDWLNIHSSTLDSASFLRSDPYGRAAWLMLLRYCVGQENGGRIVGCRAWGDTTWQQIVKVRLREIKTSSALWTWEGDDLVVSFYPIEKEQEVRQKRETAKRNGLSGGRPRRTNEKPTLVSMSVPTLVQSAKAEGERKGKEVEVEVESRAKLPLPPAIPKGEDPFEAQAVAKAMTHAEPDQPRRTLGDLKTLHPRLMVYAVDQQQAETMLTLYTWDVLHESLTEIEKRPREPGKPRVMLSELSSYLEKHYAPEAVDYQRAGLPIPQGVK